MANSTGALIDDREKSYETLRLTGLIRNGAALGILSLTFATEWMDLASAGQDLSAARDGGVMLSPSTDARESLVMQPGDFEVFGLPLSATFISLLMALFLRLLFSRGRRLHPVWPLLLTAVGTAMMGTVLGYAVRDATAQFFTSAFYLALAAFVLTTLFDLFEVLDWHKLSARGDSGPSV